MAETQHSAQAAYDSHVEREMKIEVRPYGWDMWQFQGTRAQLEAEGVIPAATEWPASGDRWIEWTAGRLRYRLNRRRPEWLKGPKKLWINGDWWSLRCEPIKVLDLPQQRVADAARALERQLYLQSPAGRRATHEQLRRVWKASDDAAFQSFKALVPGLIPPRRGRRPGRTQA